MEEHDTSPHTESIIRTITLVIVWINYILQKYGLHTIPILSHDEIALGLTIIVTSWGWVKNNYLTLKGRKQKAILKIHELE